MTFISPEHSVRELGGHETVIPPKMNGAANRSGINWSASDSQERLGRSEGLRLPLLWLDEIEPILIAQDFVQGVLTAQGAAMAYGESNAGKTFFVTDLALHVAAGKPWNGRRVDQGGVIYCVLEGGNGFRNRVFAWRQANVRPDVEVPFAAIPCQINLLNPESDTPKLIEVIRAAAEQIEHPVKLVIIDTLSRALAGGNENAPDDMGALVQNMDAIRAATGACVLFVHHCGKDQAKGARGHSSLRAAIDTEIEVKADDSTGAKEAHVVKQRDLKKGDVFHFRLTQVTLGQNQHGEDVTTCLVTPDEKSKGPTSAAKPLNESERGWLKDLSDMFAEPGAARLVQPVGGDASESFHAALSRQQVRDGYRQRGRFALDADGNLTGADRERLRSVLNRLRDKEKIRMTLEWVWLL